MKQYIEVMNKGEIEIAGLTLIGACTKNDDQIGFFGSGNKYAIATLLRNKVDFRIYSGINHIEVETKEVSLRGEVFNKVIIDGENTSITTRMGPDWSSWYVLREFVSNAIDEGGYSRKIVDQFNPEIGFTKIYIELNDEYKSIIDDFDNYFLNRSSVLESPVLGTDIVEGDGTFNIFRKGISVIEQNESTKSLYWYNFNRIEINESRIYKYNFQIEQGIGTALSLSKSREIIENYLQNRKSTIENDATFYGNKFSDTWLEVLEGKTLYLESVVRDSDDKNNSIVISDELGRCLSKQFKQLKIVGINTENYKKIVIDTDDSLNLVENSDLETEEITEEQREDIISKLKISVENLSKIGYTINFKIELVKTQNHQDYWFSKNTLHIDIFEIKDLEEAMIYGYFIDKGYTQYSREFESMLINTLISYSKKLNEINR